MRNSGRIAIWVAFALSLAPARAFQPPPSDLARQAQQELFAARYNHAAVLYQELVDQSPNSADSYYGLVRALVHDHRGPEAYRAADLALQRVPQSAGGQAAAGLADYRRGDLDKAEAHFRAALAVDSHYAGALSGLASIYSSASLLKTARGFLLDAYRQWSGDPSLIVAHANTLKGADHIAALEQALAIYDPESDEALGLRSHIASDRALGDRKPRRLVSPYESSSVKLFQIMDTPRRQRGVGIHVRLNQKVTVRLLLDTGASGISVSPRLAEKAGLEILTRESAEAKGIGDARPEDSLRYLASQIQAGDVTLADCPVSAFESARSPDFDGIIGADVFQQFLVTIDFVKLQMLLEPRPGGRPTPDGEPHDAAEMPAPGFYRAFRFGNHLTLPTSVNRQAPRLFLIDSGAATNLIDTATASESTSVYRDRRTVVRGVQGNVGQTSRADRVSLAFAGFRQENPDLIAISLEKLDDQMEVGLAGILGMPVLGQMRLTIDYREGTVRLDHKQ